MLKKFNEFIIEKDIDWSKDPRNKIFTVLTDDDVEDQFLRLKEVFGCNVSTIKSFYKSPTPKDMPRYDVLIHYTLKGPKAVNFKENVEKELNQIKYRMEIMYPVKIFMNISLPTIVEIFLDESKLKS